MKIYDLDVDRILYNYYNEYDENVTVPENVATVIENFQFKSKKDIRLILKRIIITILTLLGISGGLVLANKFLFKKNPNYNLGKGIETAIEHGYISDLEMKTQSSDKIIINDIEYDIVCNIGVNDFMMDNQNISATFEIILNEKVIDLINLEKIKSVYIEDLMITDEENHILFCQGEESFYNYCKFLNLNYNYYEYNDYYFNSGLNSFVTRTEDYNKIDFVYNIYLDSMIKNYPKSKKVFFDFSKICLLENNEKVALEMNGDWNFEIDVPSIMYERGNISYTVVECPDNISVKNATLSDTGFEFTCVISGINTENDKNRYDEIIKRFENNMITEKDVQNAERAVLNREMIPIEVNYFADIFGYYNETIDDCTNIKNEDGRVFLISGNPGRKQNYNYIDNNLYEFSDTFELTKYDASKNLTLTIVWFNNELKKEKCVIKLVR